MKIVQAPRASAIIYHLLSSQLEKRPWLLPANICPIVPLTFLKAGVSFEFVDISATTLNMDLDQAANWLKNRSYGGVLYAHTYGDPFTPSDFFSWLKDRYPELLLIDDRCLCIPDLSADAKDAVDVQLYSTGYAKIVELNVGGYAFLKDDVSYQPHHVPFEPHSHDAIEKSYKDAISEHRKYVYQDMAWLETETAVWTWDEYRKKIELGLASSLKQREYLNQIYSMLLPNEIQFPERFQTWRFNIRVQKKDAVLNAIFSSGLFASSHYASLADIFSDGRAPQAEVLAKEVINLFNDHHFTVQQTEQICTVIRENLS
jgi:hypothetical protein